jgi:hypothetical protein
MDPGDVSGGAESLAAAVRHLSYDSMGVNFTA